MKPFILTAEDRAKLRKQVLATLKTGRRSAVTGKDIAHAVGQSDDRKVRLIIRELIAEGIPVASSVSEPMGFYIVANEHEAADYMRVLKVRIREDTARLRDFEAACHRFPIPEQHSLFEEVQQ
jgi:hypothetical protein